MTLSKSFQRSSDLQLGNQKVTLNHLVDISLSFSKLVPPKKISGVPAVRTFSASTASRNQRVSSKVRKDVKKTCRLPMISWIQICIWLIIYKLSWCIYIYMYSICICWLCVCVCVISVCYLAIFLYAWSFQSLHSEIAPLNGQIATWIRMKGH